MLGNYTANLKGAEKEFLLWLRSLLGGMVDP